MLIFTPTSTGSLAMQGSMVSQGSSFFCLHLIVSFLHLCLQKPTSPLYKSDGIEFAEIIWRGILNFSRCEMVSTPYAFS